MSTDGDRLRELLRERTPQPPRPIDLDDVAARVARPARAPIPLRRLSPLAAVAVIAAVVVLVVALQRGSHSGTPAPTHPASPHPVPTSAPTHVPTPTHAPSRPAQPPAGEGAVYSTDVYSVDFAVVVVGPGLDGKGPNRLLATTDGGRTFTDIGPRISRAWSPDSLFILDRSHIWFSVYNGGTIGVDVYRTTDGGKHWQRASAGRHNAGGFSTLDFVDPLDGFVFDADQGGNRSLLFVTHNGGVSWQLLADTQSGNVPPWGSMHFVTDRLGWIANGQLFRTTDGGAHWAVEVVPDITFASIGPPALRGATLLMPVQVQVGHGTGDTSAERSNLTIYSRPEAGGAWTPGAAFTVAGPEPGDQRSPSVAFLAANSAWASALDNGLVVAYRWDGNRWTRIAAPYGRTIFQPHIQAVDDKYAWLSFTQANNTIKENGSEVYRTSDGGRSWQRIDLAALATK